MKKLIFTMLIALFSILSFNEAKAQSCPPGYQTGNIIINICGCDYYINYCFHIHTYVILLHREICLKSCLCKPESQFEK